MELLDGYVVGIYNYCDRWCETCPFTARCRVFATSAELDAGDDPVMAALGAGLMRSTAAMTEALRTAALLAADIDDEDIEAGVPDDAERVRDVAPASHEALRERAIAYGLRTAAWLASQHPIVRRRPDDGFGVVTWFHHMIGAKVDRALHGLAEAEGEIEDLTDAEGSAKVALVGAERSRAAWIDLVAEGRVRTVEAAPFIDALTSIIDDLDTLVPGARVFVRPGFDEPEQAARLFAGEL